MERGYVKDYFAKLKEISIYHISGFFILLLAALLLRNHLWAIIVLSILYLADIVFDFFLKIFLRPIYHAMPLGIELVTFNTIIAALVFGPTLGAICGLVFGITYYLIIFNLNSMYQIINIPMYGVIGYLAGIITTGNIVGLGVGLSLLYGIVTSALITIFMGGKLYKSIIFIVSNVLFNYWLFTNMSTIVLNIIS